MRKNNSAGRLLAAGIVALWLYLFLPVRFFDLPFSFGQVEERAFSAVWLFLTSMILIILFYKKKQIAFRFSICDILILMYVVYMLIRLYRNLLEHQHIITLFSLTLLYFIFRSLGIRHARLLIPVLAIALTVQVIQDYFLYHCNLLNAGSAISGTNQSIDIFFTGIYRNTGIWGGFVGIVLVGFYGLWLYSRRYKLVQAVLILFSLVLLVYSQSRAAWIGTMAGILLLTGIYLWEKYGSRLRKQIIIALLCSIPVAVFVGNMFFHLKPVSASGRIYIWEIASRMFADHLLFGMGIDRFQSQYMYYQAAYFLQKPDSPFAQIADDINVPFSEPLKVAVEQGVVGLTFVSGILLSVLIPVFISSRGRKYSPLEEAEGIPELQIQVSSKRQYNCRLTEGSIALTADHKFEMQTSFIYAAILITLLVFSCFSYPFTYIQFRFLLIVCVAVLSRQHTVCGFTVHCKKTGIWLFVPYTAIACFVAFTGIRYATTMQKLHRTISRSSINKPEDVLPVFRDMEPVLKSTPVFTNSYAVFLFYNQDYERAVDKFNETLSYQASYTTCLELGRCYDRLGETDCALAYWELCSRMIPNRFEPMYLQIEACHRTGRYSCADSLTTLILQKKRKVDTIRIDRMIRDVKEWRKQREVNDEQ